MGVCAHCGYRGAAVYLSVAARAEVCPTCYGSLPTARERRAVGPKPPTLKSPKRPEPTRYAKFHAYIWDRLETLTGHTVFAMCDGTGRLLSYCPACLVGTMTVTFRATDPPAYQVSHHNVIGQCERGCTQAEITEAMRR